jgi:serine/threonine-protein kinase HipA
VALRWLSTTARKVIELLSVREQGGHGGAGDAVARAVALEGGFVLFMEMVQSLEVRFHDRAIAELGFERGRLQLAYDAGSDGGISVRLPPRPDPYDGDECAAFFQNLLPEGGFRESICRRLSLPAVDDFGLLTSLGAECAGAARLVTDAEAHPSYAPVAESELRGWLRRPEARPLPRDVPGLAVALSGAQDKLAIHVADGDPYLCEHGAPTTLILKPDIPDGFNRIELSGLNELFCMQLAASIGVRVPKSSWRFGAYAVERYDRVSRRNQLARLHQEDFTQILGLPPTSKYAVTWRQCFEVVDRYVKAAEAARRELVDRLFFNLLIGNCDAHGKNFALLFGDGGAELAPGYDLLCTQIYPSLSEAFSMRIGPARRQDELTALAWQELAKDARLPLLQIKQRGAELSSAVQLALRELPSQISSQNPSLVNDVYPARRRDDFFRKLADIIVGNCKRVSRSLLGRA